MLLIRTIELPLSDFCIIKSLFLGSVFKAEISSLFKLESARTSNMNYLHGTSKTLG